MNLRSNSHIIMQQSFDISAESEESAMQIIDITNTIYTTHIYQILQNTFTKYCSRGNHIKIDNLKLDLGEIEINFYTEQLPERIQQQLEDKLKQIIGSHIQSGQISLVNNAQNQIEIFLTYLKNGYIPWNTNINFDPIHYLETIIRRNSNADRKLIRKAGLDPLVKMRIIRSFDEKAYNKTIKYLEPINGTIMVELKDLVLSSPSASKTLSTTQSNYIEGTKLIILEIALIETGTYFNKKTLILSIIKRISSHFNISYIKMIDTLAKNVEILSNQLGQNPELRQILLDLHTSSSKNTLQELSQTQIKISNEHASRHLYDQLRHIDSRSARIWLYILETQILSSRSAKVQAQRHYVIYANLLSNFLKTYPKLDIGSLLNSTQLRELGIYTKLFEQLIDSIVKSNQPGNDCTNRLIMEKNLILFRAIALNDANNIHPLFNLLHSIRELNILQYSEFKLVTGICSHLDRTIPKPKRERSTIEPILSHKPIENASIPYSPHTFHSGKTMPEVEQPEAYDSETNALYKFHDSIGYLINHYAIKYNISPSELLLSKIFSKLTNHISFKHNLPKHEVAIYLSNYIIKYSQTNLIKSHLFTLSTDQNSSFHFFQSKYNTTNFSADQQYQLSTHEIEVLLYELKSIITTYPSINSQFIICYNTILAKFPKGISISKTYLHQIRNALVKQTDTTADRIYTFITIFLNAYTTKAATIYETGKLLKLYVKTGDSIILSTLQSESKLKQSIAAVVIKSPRLILKSSNNATEGIRWFKLLDVTSYLQILRKISSQDISGICRIYDQIESEISIHALSLSNIQQDGIFRLRYHLYCFIANGHSISDLTLSSMKDLLSKSLFGDKYAIESLCQIILSNNRSIRKTIEAQSNVTMKKESRAITLKVTKQHLLRETLMAEWKELIQNISYNQPNDSHTQIKPLVALIRKNSNSFLKYILSADGRQMFSKHINIFEQKTLLQSILPPSYKPLLKQTYNLLALCQICISQAEMGKLINHFHLQLLTQYYFQRSNTPSPKSWAMLLIASIRAIIKDTDTLYKLESQLISHKSPDHNSGFNLLAGALFTLTPTKTLNAFEPKIRPPRSRVTDPIYNYENTEDPIYLGGAGVILIHPFLPTLFQKIGLMVNSQFIDDEAVYSAINAIYYAAYGRPPEGEHQLPLCKLLCGVDINHPIKLTTSIDTSTIALIESLLQAVIQQWSILKQTSIAGLRETFLQREGSLQVKEDEYQLTIKQMGLDILIDHLPWGISKIKYSWMPKMISITWR